MTTQHATAIQWTHRPGTKGETWNVVTGCSHVSPGCEHCYAETLATGRLKGSNGYPGLEWTAQNAEINVVLHEDRIEEPLHWRSPRTVFVCSMSDLFHERVPDEFLDRVFLTMGKARAHTFLVLTKRPERMRDYFAHAGERLTITGFSYDTRPPYPNVWLGTSVEDQRRVDERVRVLNDTPAVVRFLSCEPLLEAINVEPYLARTSASGSGWDIGGIEWVIVGGESGRGARPFDLAWARSLRDQCDEAGVAFFLKQLGAAPTSVPDRISHPGEPHTPGRPFGFYRLLNDGHGGDADEWPPDLRIRQWPT